MTKRTRVEDLACTSSLRRWFTSQISSTNAKVSSEAIDFLSLMMIALKDLEL